MAIATTKEYTANGSQTIFGFPFTYLKTEDVKVKVNGALQDPISAYTFATATSIQFNSAPSNGVKVFIYRNTDIDSAKAVFASGSSYRSTDLNDNFDQNLFFSQEVADNSNPLLSTSLSFDLDQSAKTDGSVVYYSSTASKFKADTNTLSTIVDGGSF
tara:strand:- start:3130 stop:3603 length:474 start_codon:yes stop_codon:yes gene_type:complete